jgi:hypothetical protein
VDVRVMVTVAVGGQDLAEPPTRGTGDGAHELAIGVGAVPVSRDEKAAPKRGHTTRDL